MTTLQEIKKQMYAMRNGAVGDLMRRMGAPYQIIFGCNLPQLNEIATQIGKSKELADELWQNRSTRESMLLAPMIFPLEALSRATALKWASEASTTEVADVLCLKLLKHHPSAIDVANKLMESPTPLHRYTALRLMLNLLPNHIDAIKHHAIAELHRNEPQTHPLATQLINEIDFHLENS